MGMLVIGKGLGSFFRMKINENGATHRLNPRGKPGSVCWETNSSYNRTII
jgi:hypothetical protein